MGREDREEISQPLDNSLKSCSGSNFQDHYSGALCGRKSRDLAKITIEGNECTIFGAANLKKLLVGDATKPLIPHGHHIMAGRFQQFQAAAPDILVKLDFHATRSIGTGTTRSRAASAPYAIAARTSSWTSWGYSANSSASVRPSARRSRMRDTQIRVPLTQGLPPQTAGLMVIRSRSVFTAETLYYWYHGGAAVSKTAVFCGCDSWSECWMRAGASRPGGQGRPWV